MGDNAITVIGRAEVYVSRNDKTYDQPAAQARYYPLDGDEWIIVTVRGPDVSVTNNSRRRMLLEETTKDIEGLDDVLDPRQSRAIDRVGSTIQVRY